MKLVHLFLMLIARREQMSNIGKKKDWVPCPVLSEVHGGRVACIVAIQFVEWEGDFLISVSELQADGKVTKDMEASADYFNFCPWCGRDLRQGG